MEPDKYCYEHKHYYEPSKVCEKCAAERRAVYRDAYMAALGGLAGIDGLADVETVYHAQQCALETVRQWPAMTAERDALIAKAVQG